MLLKNSSDNITPMLLLFLSSTISLWHRMLSRCSHDILFLGMNRIDQNPKCGMFIGYWEETNVIEEHACCLWIRSEVLEFVCRSLQGILAYMLCSGVLYWCHCLACCAQHPVLTLLPCTLHSPQCSQSCPLNSQLSLSFMESQILLVPGKRPSSMNSVSAWLSHTCSKNFGKCYTMYTHLTRGCTSHSVIYSINQKASIITSHTQPEGTPIVMSCSLN